MKHFDKIKKAAAWAGILLLGGIYLVTFILGISGNPATQSLLMACIICTVIIPVLLYAMMILARTLEGRGREPEKKKEQEQTEKK